MRNSILLTTLIAVFVLACSKDNQDIQGEMAVIGLHPCTKDMENRPGKGFVLLLNATDTVLTFNLPASIAQKVNTGVIVGEYLLPEANRFRTQITFRYAEADEYVSPLCRGDILIGEISKIKNQIIILDQKE